MPPEVCCGAPCHDGYAQRAAVMDMGSPAPHHGPSIRRVSLMILEKSRFSTSSPPLAWILMPRLLSRITTFSSVILRTPLAEGPIRMAAERLRRITFETATFSIVCWHQPSAQGPPSTNASSPASRYEFVMVTLLDADTSIASAFGTSRL